MSKYQNTVVLDNGGHTLKAGVVGQSDFVCVPNMAVRDRTGKVHVHMSGDDVQLASDGQILRPTDRGYPLRWSVQASLWDHVFGHQCLGVDPTDSALCLATPPFQPKEIAKACIYIEREREKTGKEMKGQGVLYEHVFEYYGFQGLFRHIPAFFASFQVDTQAGLYIDSGHSGTWTVPIIHNQVLLHGVRRVDVGGAVLNKELRRVVSMAQFDLTREALLAEQIGHLIFRVSDNFRADMMSFKEQHSVGSLRSRCRPLSVLLPDYTTSKAPVVLDPTTPAPPRRDVYRPGPEQVYCPELLFHPEYAGIAQGGVQQAAAQGLACLPSAVAEACWGSVVPIGGVTNIPGYRQRLQQELSGVAPSCVNVSVLDPGQSESGKGGEGIAFRGMVKYAAGDEFPKSMVTLDLYKEYGDNLCTSRFAW
ncbi:actin-related protein 6 [Kipferlia bialata]|uniref:Actin-related protein 6 n=1 Tax=Kipferlia bialata TaxID=797122 RepID=A0A9K3CSU3_9EUKA|nr:actin-related protein 6 [Kipferlia bialata]GIQ83652.1 actin-related protein 6 [Kipferlia bialata]|eukprot:g3851.t1